MHEIKNLVGPLLDDDIQEIFQIKGRGLVNKVYKIATSTKSYVLRIDPDEDSMIRFEKEAWCYRSASAVGILSPEVVCVGQTSVGNPYILISYIEGIDGDLAQQKKRQISGELLGVMQERSVRSKSRVLVKKWCQMGCLVAVGRISWITTSRV